MPTLTENVKALEKTRAHVARLENEIAEDLGLTRPLQIPTGAELQDRGSRLLVVKKKKRKYTRRAAASAKAGQAPGKNKRRPRTEVTDALRMRVLEMHTKHKTSVYAIAKKLGIANGTAKRIVEAAKKK